MNRKSELLARSKAGHDKGEVFVVLQYDETFCLLADGRRRTLSHPKRKKWKHVQVIKQLPDEVVALMQDVSLDAHLRKILKAYENRKGNSNENCGGVYVEG